MKDIYRGTITFALAGAWVLVAASLAGGQAHPTVEAPPIAGDTGSMARFYAGLHQRVGTFPGKLVCLRCDLAHGPDAAQQCAKEGHRHALLMDDGSMVHPLVAGTDALVEQINSGDLHLKKVTVHGLYYPSTGVILADSIKAAD